MKKTREQKGITLIALIITIVILLILAVVTINAIQGDGIIKYAQKAADDYTAKANEEQEELNTLLGQIEGSLKDEEEYIPIVHNDVIPKGGTYIIPDTIMCIDCDYEVPFGESCFCGLITNDNPKAIYNAGDTMPTIIDGDIYIFGDYKYTYVASENGWGVITHNKDKTKYEQFLVEINGKNITGVTYVFSGCANLIDASNIIIPDNITDMECTFDGCAALTTLPNLSNCTQITNMFATFSGCKALTSAPNLSNCTQIKYMEYAFMDCTALTNPPDLSNCTQISSIRSTFYGCTALTAAPNLSNCTQITNMDEAFRGCTALTTAPIISESVTSIQNAFYGCTSLAGSITINSTPKYWGGYCLKGTQVTEILGNCEETVKAKILATK